MMYLNNCIILLRTQQQQQQLKQQNSVQRTRLYKDSQQYSTCELIRQTVTEFRDKIAQIELVFTLWMRV